MGDNVIFFHAGFKSYDISKFRSSAETWFEWTERSRHLMRKATVNIKVMKWIVQVFITASKEHKQTDRRRKLKDHFAEFFCALKYNEHGRYISVIAIQGGSRSVIITPEVTLNAGWGDIAQKINRFINATDEAEVNAAARRPCLEALYMEAF